ncbi:MAG: hypothetical protein ACON49_06990 [Candidatus Puniceispirillaceae bacterium]
MIEVVAIEHQSAEAELLRLGAQFAQSRLFTAKQRKKLKVVIEVSGVNQPRAISRDQLATRPGLFRSAYYHYDFAISLVNGFDVAVMQMMHEVTHISQVISQRYQLSLKSVKRDGEKQKLYTAKWCGKKSGLIDDTPWEARPWEQEASAIGTQLTGEFMAMLYGTQSDFAAQGRKKELKLYEFRFALPTGTMPQAEITMQGNGQADLTNSASDMMTDIMPHTGAMQMAGDLPSHQPSDFSISDGLGTFGSGHDSDSGGVSSSYQDELSVEPQKQKGTLTTYVQGIEAPVTLHLAELEKKRQELAARGLLEK